jgi:hypothetical protein
MRCVVFVKATQESEAGIMPSQQLMAEMGAFNEELVRAGVGRPARPAPERGGKRVAFNGRDRTVIDGPFAETKELVAGFWIWTVASMTKRSMGEAVSNPMTGRQIEIRPVFEAEDFGAALTPELRAQEERLRAEIASRT